MKVRLDEHWRRVMAQLPESGMGYQRVDVRLDDGREVIDTVVFNGQDLELPDDCSGAAIQDVQLHQPPGPS